MTDNNVIKLAQPGTFIDSLTEILRSGARALLTQAVARKCESRVPAAFSRKSSTNAPRRARAGSNGRSDRRTSKNLLNRYQQTPSPPPS